MFYCIFATLGNAVQGYFEKAKCSQLHKELLTLVRCRYDTAERLITLAKLKNPGKAERWYLEKVIDEDWFDRYSWRFDDYRLQKKKTEREQMAL